MTRGRLRVLIAPDSFKGSLTSVEVARALATGWRSVRVDDEIRLAPLADGGEGTLAAIEAAGGWDRREAVVQDPIGRPIRAPWLRREAADGTVEAVVELASASGLSRLAPDELAPMTATTYGTGELIRAAVADGARRLILGIGGSATSDGGAGILHALSGRDAAASADVDGFDRRLRGVDLRIACDVTNPLLGPTGAAATYGPQKGATPAQVAELDARLARWADVVRATTGRDERSTPGAGAAGGTGFALLSIRDAFSRVELVPGVELVMDAVGFADRLAASDLVITGEGRIDAQTAFGKTALGVAKRAQAAGVACIAVGGGVEPEGAAALARLNVTAIPVHERLVDLAAAMAAGAEPVERCGRRLARIISEGGGPATIPA